MVQVIHTVRWHGAPDPSVPWWS